MARSGQSFVSTRWLSNVRVSLARTDSRTRFDKPPTYNARTPFPSFTIMDAARRELLGKRGWERVLSICGRVV